MNSNRSIPRASDDPASSSSAAAPDSRDAFDELEIPTVELDDDDEPPSSSPSARPAATGPATSTNEGKSQRVEPAPPSASELQPSEQVVWLLVNEVRPHPLHREIYETRAEATFEEYVRRGLTDRTLEPGTVTPDRLIISGSRRWAAARKLGQPEMPFIVRRFENEPLAIVLANQQRIKTTGERAAEARILREEFRKEAAERKMEGARKGGIASGRVRRGVDRGSKTKLVPDLGRGSPREARSTTKAVSTKENKSDTRIAKAVGMKPETLRKVEHVLGSVAAPAKLKDDLKHDRVSADKAYKETRALEVKRPAKEEPKRKAGPTVELDPLARHLAGQVGQMLSHDSKEAQELQCLARSKKQINPAIRKDLVAALRKLARTANDLAIALL